MINPQDDQKRQAEMLERLNSAPCEASVGDIFVILRDSAFVTYNDKVASYTQGQCMTVIDIEKAIMARDLPRNYEERSITILINGELHIVQKVFFKSYYFKKIT